MHKIWIYGMHSCKQAIINKKRTIIKIIVTKNLYSEILNFTEKINKKIPILILSDKEIENTIMQNNDNKSKVASQINHQGIAILTNPIEPLDIKNYINNILNKENKSLILCLDQIQDTNNFGSIIRSAVAFGVNAIMIQKRNSVTLTPAAIKIASGGAEKIDIISVTNIAESLEILKKNGFWCYAIDHNAANNIKEIDKTNKHIVLVVGSEENGIRSLIKKRCDYHAKIKMDTCQMESLNVAIATSIALYEFYQY